MPVKTRSENYSVAGLILPRTLLPNPTVPTVQAANIRFGDIIFILCVRGEEMQEGAGASIIVTFRL